VVSWLFIKGKQITKVQGSDLCTFFEKGGREKTEDRREKRVSSLLSSVSCLLSYY
jgi:hypothetical protein